MDILTLIFGVLLYLAFCYGLSYIVEKIGESFFKQKD